MEPRISRTPESFECAEYVKGSPRSDWHSWRGLT